MIGKGNVGGESNAAFPYLFLLFLFLLELHPNTRRNNIPRHPNIFIQHHDDAVREGGESRRGNKGYFIFSYSRRAAGVGLNRYTSYRRLGLYLVNSLGGGQEESYEEGKEKNSYTEASNTRERAPESWRVRH